MKVWDSSWLAQFGKPLLGIVRHLPRAGPARLSVSHLETPRPQLCIDITRSL